MGNCCSDDKAVQEPQRGHGQQARHQRQPQPAQRSNSSGRRMDGGGGRNTGDSTFQGQGRKLGGESGKQADAREAAARAAEARQAKAAPGLSSETSQNMKLNSQKADLIGRINSICAQLNEEPPFGLNVCSVDQLIRHQSHLEDRLKAKRGGR